MPKEELLLRWMNWHLERADYVQLYLLYIS